MPSQSVSAPALMSAGRAHRRLGDNDDAVLRCSVTCGSFPACGREAREIETQRLQRIGQQSTPELSSRHLHEFKLAQTVGLGNGIEEHVEHVSLTHASRMLRATLCENSGVIGND